MLKPLQSATLTSMPLTSMSKAPKAGEAGKRKRGGKNQHTAKEENKSLQETMSFLAKAIILYLFLLP